MVNEIKTVEDRRKTLIEKGKKNGYITYEELAEELKGLEVDSDTLDDLYNALMENNIEDCLVLEHHLFLSCVCMCMYTTK